MSLPEKLKCKLLKLDMDGDGWVDGQGYHYMPFPGPFFEWRKKRTFSRAMAL